MRVTRQAAKDLRVSLSDYSLYHIKGLGSLESRTSPSRHITMVLSLDREISVRSPGFEFAGRLVVSGLRHGFRTVRSRSDPFGIRLSISVLATRSLFGMPARELANQNVGLSELTNSVGALPDQLENSKPENVFRELDSFFGNQKLRFDSERGVRKELVWVWNRIFNCNGTTRVVDLAAELGWSRRHLTGQFRNEFGITTKQAMRIAQFERACALMRCMPNRDLAQIANEAGFADQAHLARTWAEFTGWSPTQWLVHEFPFLQDSELAGLR